MAEIKPIGEPAPTQIPENWQIPKKDAEGFVPTIVDTSNKFAQLKSSHLDRGSLMTVNESIDCFVDQDGRLTDARWETLGFVTVMLGGEVKVIYNLSSTHDLAMNGSTEIEFLPPNTEVDIIEYSRQHLLRNDASGLANTVHVDGHWGIYRDEPYNQRLHEARFGEIFLPFKEDGIPMTAPAPKLGNYSGMKGVPEGFTIEGWKMTEFANYEGLMAEEQPLEEGIDEKTGPKVVLFKDADGNALWKFTYRIDPSESGDERDAQLVMSETYLGHEEKEVTKTLRVPIRNSKTRIYSTAQVEDPNNPINPAEKGGVEGAWRDIGKAARVHLGFSKRIKSPR